MKSTITQIQQNGIKILGKDISEIINEFSVGGLVYFFLKRQKPTPQIAEICDKMILASCDHGLTPPSTVATRLSASCGASLSMAIIAGLTCFGERHATITKAAQFYKEGLQSGKTIKALVAEHRRIPGFGHPLHQIDPRVPVLLDYVQKNGIASVHVDFLLALQKALDLPINCAGIVGAIIDDLSLPIESAGVFVIMGRCIGLAAHYQEQVDESRKIILYDPETEKLTYSIE